VVRILTLEVLHLQASVVHPHPDDDHLPQLITDQREISIPIDQELFLVHDLGLRDVIAHALDPSQGLDLLREDVVAEEIALDEMAAAEEEAQVIAATAVMMTGAAVEAVAMEGGEGVERRYVKENVLEYCLNKATEFGRDGKLRFQLDFKWG
jgi:hypothetical protein